LLSRVYATYISTRGDVVNLPSMYVAKLHAIVQNIPKQWNYPVMFYKASLESLLVLEFRNPRVMASCILDRIVRVSESALTLEFATSKKRRVFLF